jgi:hypothetical protein
MGLKYILFLCLLVTSKSLGKTLKGNTFVSGQKFAVVLGILSCTVTVQLQLWSPRQGNVLITEFSQHAHTTEATCQTPSMYEEIANDKRQRRVGQSQN